MNTKASFTKLHNEFIKDKSLTLKSKGLYSILKYYSKIPNFTIKKSFILSQCSEGSKSFNKIWDELKQKGYLDVVKLIPDQTKSGRFEYVYNIFGTPEKLCNNHEINIQNNAEVNFNKIESETKIAEVVGSNSYETVENSYNTGDVSGSDFISYSNKNDKKKSYVKSDYNVFDTSVSYQFNNFKSTNMIKNIDRHSNYINLQDDNNKKNSSYVNHDNSYSFDFNELLNKMEFSSISSNDSKCCKILLQLACNYINSRDTISINKCIIKKKN